VAGAFPFRLAAVALGALVVAATAAGVVLAARFVSPGRTVNAAPAHLQARGPTAAAVADQLAGASNARSEMTADGRRISHVSCISGGPGSYACSYVRTVPGKGVTCALAILRWTPSGASTFTVQTAGRVALPPRRCGPVAKVLHVLGTSG
jgi:hypothetical protein